MAAFANTLDGIPDQHRAGLHVTPTERLRSRFQRIQRTREAILERTQGPFFVTLLQRNDLGEVAEEGAGTCEATLLVAATCIVDGTHRLANEAEIKRFTEEQANRARDYRVIELSRKETTAVIISGDTAKENGIPTGKKEK